MPNIIFNLCVDIRKLNIIRKGNNYVLINIALFHKQY